MKLRGIARQKYILRMIPVDLYDNGNWDFSRLIIRMLPSRLGQWITFRTPRVTATLEALRSHVIVFCEIYRTIKNFHSN
jgi:hypothetical protein